MNPQALCSRSLALAVFALLPLGSVLAQERGFYREPALHDQTLVFTAEGDLWTVGFEGGLARRLTSHAGVEQAPSISPDGGVGDFEAYVSDAACNQEWAVSFSQPEPGNPDAQMAPPPIFEIREQKTGVCLDAYQFAGLPVQIIIINNLN